MNTKKMIKPFHIKVSNEILDLINSKIAKYPWHEMPDKGGWTYGTNINYMKEICEYWLNNFDWRKHENKINKFSNFITKIDNFSYM